MVGWLAGLGWLSAKVQCWHKECGKLQSLLLLAGLLAALVRNRCSVTVVSNGAWAVHGNKQGQLQMCPGFNVKYFVAVNTPDLLQSLCGTLALAGIWWSEVSRLFGSSQVWCFVFCVAFLGEAGISHVQHGVCTARGRTGHEPENLVLQKSQAPVDRIHVVARRGLG